MENTEESKEISQEPQDDEKFDKVFKKPILIGKIGKLPKKLGSDKHDTFDTNYKKTQELRLDETENELQSTSSNVIMGKTEEIQLKEAQSFPLPYNEPIWSGIPVSNGKDYSFDVLKNGSIIENINLMSKPYWIFGRLLHCDISMEHPTISRYHAILQYRKEPSQKDGTGFYIYDLDSTHGTFLNKNRLKPKVFVRIQVGHILKLGCSTRSYILVGPECDEEEESELTVTELKEKRAEEIRKREEEALRIQKEVEEKKRRDEERGVDWGLGEDADEETDLSENPYAQSNNEELYLDDPKKALRGFFEREGLELEYKCEEQGMGQFICKVELPVDDEMGRNIVAEVLHKGKKKEAVVQCALEACRILDRYGVLRQATHESRKRKSKNWEDNDYYDSDEDTFLDRTGTIEKKREKRMNAKAPQKVETYESLVEKEKSIANSIKDLETRISSIRAKIESENNQNNDEDSLDSYMKILNESNIDKRSISKLRTELSNLKLEQTKIVKLINLVRPANLPPLIIKDAPSTSKDSTNKSLPLFGKRRKIQFKMEQKLNYDLSENNDLDDEEDDIEDKIDEKTIEINSGHEESTTITETERNENNDEIQASSSSTSSDQASTTTNSLILKILENTMTFKEFDRLLKTNFPSCTSEYQDKLLKILDTIKDLATNEDRMLVDLKTLSAKNDKVVKLLEDLKHVPTSDKKLEHRAWSELNRIFDELNAMTDQKFKVLSELKKMGSEIKTIFDVKPQEKNQDIDDRRKRKNQKRMQHKKEKQEQEKQKEYEEDSSRENYDMWVPPKDQSGDGRTSLNDKLGY
ncbi:kanadaptin [Diorhabda sublineata]|uniref:kanadaptin n=1 Tax=Diorhabda sublineata TaxID=1163346 RepID=UPI0024E15563|nr:kanadaptin [Diorhabda sublineata]